MPPPLTLLPSWFWDGQSPTAQPGAPVCTHHHTYLGHSHPPGSPTPLQLPLPGRLITPAFTNFHTHLELSSVPRPPYAGDFIQWLGHVIANGPTTDDAIAHATTHGALESLRHGVCRVVDITRHPHLTRPALARTPLLAQSCAEITGLAKRKPQGQQRLRDAIAAERFCEPTLADRITPGLSPHASYSTDHTLFTAAADHCRAHAQALTTHLAETPEERQFLATHTGPFRDLWSKIANGTDWDDSVETFSAGPIHWLEHHDVLRGTHLLAAHVNDATDDELRLLASRQVTVVHCPRTHAYFRRPPFPLARYLAAGLTIKLGTDSSASAADQNLLADLQLFARQNPHLSPAQLFSTITSTPLTPNTPAHFAIWKVQTNNPLQELLATENLTPESLYIAGQQVNLTPENKE